MEHRAVRNSTFRSTGLEVASRHAVISAPQRFEVCVERAAFLELQL